MSWAGEKCKEKWCRGIYFEATLQDSWEGVLTCSKCGKKKTPPSQLKFYEGVKKGRTVTISQNLVKAGVISELAWKHGREAILTAVQKSIEDSLKV